MTPHHADRFTGDFNIHADTYGWQFFTRQAQGLTGEKVEYLCRSHRFGNTFGQRLAFFTRQ